jgi:flavin-binding protein dodecin
VAITGYHARGRPPGGWWAGAALETTAPGEVECSWDTSPRETIMADRGKIYKLIELVGVSEISTEEAIRSAIAQASQRLKGLAWYQVTETRGLIQDGKVSEFQVTLKIGFRILSEGELAGD